MQPAIITAAGLAKIEALGEGEGLGIKAFALGDAEDAPLDFPSADQSALYSEQHRDAVNAVYRNDFRQLEAQCFVKDVKKPFIAREIGLYDAEDVLIALAKIPKTEFLKMPTAAGEKDALQAEILVALDISERKKIYCASSSVHVIATPELVRQEDERTRALLAEKLASDLDACETEVKRYAEAQDLERSEALKTLLDEKMRALDEIAKKAIKDECEALAKAFFKDLTADFESKDQSIIDKIESDWGPSAYEKLADHICPIGTILAWPSRTPPGPGWAFCHGQAFDKDAHPRCAALYPSGYLPDMRGQVLKGITAERGPLTHELDAIKYHGHIGEALAVDLGSRRTDSSGDHSHSITGIGIRHDPDGALPSGSTPTGPRREGPTGVAGAHTHKVKLGKHAHAVKVEPTGADENRVKNIGVEFIVRLG